ncbi:MAG TPA: hypothetical protein VNB06_01825 [Thermoanaerobaculia bacterium]|nr:hypothetical protein [Thermoanaerobaculia bacterium]
MTPAGTDHHPSQQRSPAAEERDRNVAARRTGLVSALAEARGALREVTGGRARSGWTGPILAAGIGLVAAMAVRRFLRL